MVLSLHYVWEKDGFARYQYSLSLRTVVRLMPSSTIPQAVVFPAHGPSLLKGPLAVKGEAICPRSGGNEISRQLTLCDTITR